MSARRAVLLAFLVDPAKGFLSHVKSPIVSPRSAMGAVPAAKDDMSIDAMLQAVEELEEVRSTNSDFELDERYDPVERANHLEIQREVFDQ